MEFFSRFGPGYTASADVAPTITFKDHLEVQIDEMDLVLYHAPGETNDQIVIWWPSERVLFPADNVYRAFPNLYAVRGTQARYVITKKLHLFFMPTYIMNGIIL